MEALIRAAKGLGLHVSDSSGRANAAQKPPQVGSKRTASGNIAQSPPSVTPNPSQSPPMDTREDGPPAANTRSRSQTPSGPRALPQPAPGGIAQVVPRHNATGHLPMRAPSSLPTRKPLPRIPTPMVSGVAESMHNPQNQMEVDTGEPPTNPNPAPEPIPTTENTNTDPFTAIHAALTALAAQVEQIANKVDGSPRPPPTQQPSTGTTRNQHAEAPPPVNRSSRPKVSIPRQVNPDDGFIQEQHGRWNVVTARAIAQQTEANTSASKVAAAQG